MSTVPDTSTRGGLASKRKSAIPERLSRLANIRVIPPALRQGLTFFAASSLASALNYVYHILMGRMLGPDEYGVFASLVAILLVFSVPSSMVQTVVAHYVSGFQAQSRFGAIRALFLGTSKRVLLYASIGALAVILASPGIASFLHIRSIVPVIVLGVILIPWVLAPVASGALQGLQRFSYLGANLVLGALGRVLVGALLVSAGLGVGGALGGSFASCGVIFLLGVIALAFLFKERITDNINTSDIYQYSGRVLIGYVSLAVLTNVDILAVKHFFPPAEAGYYSAAATLGKVILFLPGAIAIFMFPKFSHLYALGKDAAAILRKSILCVIGLCAPLMVAYFVASDLLIRVLFGEGYATTVPLVGPFGLAMGFYALCNMLLLYYLSIHNTAFLRVIAACAFIEVVSLAIFHHTLMQVVVVMMVNGLLLLTMSELFCRGLTGRSSSDVRFPNGLVSPPKKS